VPSPFGVRGSRFGVLFREFKGSPFANAETPNHEQNAEPRTPNPERRPTSDYNPAVVFASAIGLSVAGSVGGLLVASIVLLVHGSVRTRIVPWLVSYAVGTLLGAALLGLLPQALGTLRPTPVFASLLAGILTFFVLEKLVLWRHCHDDDTCEVHRSTATLVIIGDAVHTFVDGVVIAAAALVSLPFGATTALAVAAHEIPQEAGDFAILLSAGYSRTRAVFLNLTSAAGGVVGARSRCSPSASTRRSRCRMSSRSPPATSSTSRWPISSRRFTEASPTRTRSGSSC
jgi:zinc and cadmium transporter